MSRTVGMVLKIADKCSPVLGAIAKKFGKTEKEAKKFSNNIRRSNRILIGSIGAVGGAVIGATTSIVLATKKVSEYGDHIDKTSKKLGMSTKEYQKWDFIMSQNGGNVDNLAGGLKAMTNHLAGVKQGSKSSIAIFKQLGVCVKDTNGQFRKQEDVFNDCVRAIQNIKNPTEKAIIGQKLFSKGFQEMKPLLDQTSDSIDKLKKEYNDLGLGMSDEDIKKAVNMTDTMDKLGRVFNVVGMQLGVTLLPYVQELANTIVENLPTIKSTLIPIIQTVGKTLGFCIKHIQGVTIAIAGLTTAVTVAKIAMLMFGASTVLALGPIIATVTATIAVVTALAVAFNKLKKSKDKTLVSKEEKEQLKDVPAVMTAKKDKTESKPKKHALGTSFSSGGTAWVGENGPELLNLNRGDSITPADKSQQIAQGNTTVNINLNVQGNVLGNREFFDEMMSLMALELRKAIPA